MFAFLGGHFLFQGGSVLVSKIIETGKMLKSKNVRYELGAKAVPPNIPKFLDCSGFVRYCFLAAGIKVPDGTYHQFNASIPISVNELKVGDIGFLQLPTDKGINHIGIYMGNSQWMHCNYSRNGITIEKTNMFKYIRRFKGVKEDYKVENTKINVDGKIIDVRSINHENQNYISLRDLEKAGLKVSYDSSKKMPVVSTK